MNARKEIKVCVDKRYRREENAAYVAVKHNLENAPRISPPTPVGNTRFDGRFAATLLTGKKLKNDLTLRVWFMGGDKRVTDKVMEVAKMWEEYANIRFEPAASQNDSHVRVAFDQADGSWSYIGTDSLGIPKNEPTMNYGWLDPDTADQEYHRVVLHEFGHQLGLTHEHQNPSVAIPWDREAVYRYYGGPPNNWSRETIDNNLFKAYSETQTNHTAFDRESIMLYAIPNELTIGDWFVGWNQALSELDKQFVRDNYPREEQKPPAEEFERVSVTKVAALGIKAKTLVTRNGKAFFWGYPYDKNKPNG